MLYCTCKDNVGLNIRNCLYCCRNYVSLQDESKQLEDDNKQMESRLKELKMAMGREKAQRKYG